MPIYKVSIHRSFDVEIQADNQNKASQFVELFLGYLDESDEKDRKRNNGSILSIEMLENQVFDIVEISGKEIL